MALCVQEAPGQAVHITNTPTTSNKREWRILSSVRHPHICGLVDRTRYENPRVRCTKLVMEIMDVSLQVGFRVGVSVRNRPYPFALT